MNWLPLVPSLHVSPLFCLGLALLGAAVGYASGLFGVGGGFMITPLLMTVFGLAVPHAVGAGLAQMIAVSVTATRRHAAAGYVDYRLGLLMTPSIILGTFAGQYALKALQALGSLTVNGHQVEWITLVISGIFILLLTGIGIYLWRSASSENTASCNEGPLRWVNGPCPIALPVSQVPCCSLVSITACGLLLGVFAGMLGIGGGVLLVPLLIMGFGIPLRIAIGSSPLLILCSAVFGTVYHAWAGNIDLRIVAALLVGSTLGVQCGAWHSHRLPEKRLQHAFAALVLAVVAMLAFRLLSLLLPGGSQS